MVAVKKLFGAFVVEILVEAANVGQGLFEIHDPHIPAEIGGDAKGADLPINAYVKSLHVKVCKMVKGVDSGLLFTGQIRVRIGVAVSDFTPLFETFDAATGRLPGTRLGRFCNARSTVCWPRWEPTDGLMLSP